MKGEWLVRFELVLPESEMELVEEKKTRSLKEKEKYEHEERTEGRNYVCRGNLVFYTYRGI